MSEVRISGSLALRTDVSGKLVIDRRRRTTVLMLSAGLQSTHALVRLLTESNDDVIAHHVIMPRPSGLHEIELRRSAAIVAWCQANIRACRLITTQLDHGADELDDVDIASIAFEAGLSCQSFYVENGRLPDRWLLGARFEGRLSSELSLAAKDCFAANCYPLEPPQLQELPPIERQAAIQQFPGGIENPHMELPSTGKERRCLSELRNLSPVLQ